MSNLHRIRLAATRNLHTGFLNSGFDFYSPVARVSPLQKWFRRLPFFIYKAEKRQY
jgi:hypothetical protein